MVSHLLKEVLGRLFDDISSDDVKEAALRHEIDIDNEDDFISNFEIICEDLEYDAYEDINQAIDDEVIYYDQAMDYIRERHAYNDWDQYEAYVGQVNSIMDVCIGELQMEIDEIGLYELVGQYYYDNEL